MSPPPRLRYAYLKLHRSVMSTVAMRGDRTRQDIDRLEKYPPSALYREVLMKALQRAEALRHNPQSTVTYAGALVRAGRIGSPRWS
jgi:hypothetical protein